MWTLFYATLHKAWALQIEEGDYMQIVFCVDLVSLITHYYTPIYGDVLHVARPNRRRF